MTLKDIYDHLTQERLTGVTFLHRYNRVDLIKSINVVIGRKHANEYRIRASVLRKL